MIGAKLKIALLYDLWNEDPEAAAAKEEATPTPKPRKKAKKVKKEKTDREEIFEAIQKLGHEPSYFELDGRPQSLHSLSRCDADLIFNLTESFDGDDTKEMNVVAYVDLLGLRYTGAGPHAIFMSQDKAIAKKIFAFHGIKTPFFATSYRGRIEHAHDISFPLIVKPAWEDGSIGIDAGSVVKNIKEMMERVEYIQDEFDSPALIEEYIEGREIYAGILGNYERAQVLPLVELDLSRLPEGTPKIASYDVKFEKNTEAYKLTKSQIAEDLDEATREAAGGYGAGRVPRAEAARLRAHRHAAGSERRCLRDRSESESVAGEPAGICHGREGLWTLLHGDDRHHYRLGHEPISECQPRECGGDALELRKHFVIPKEVRDL